MVIDILCHCPVELGLTERRCDGIRNANRKECRALDKIGEVSEIIFHGR